MEKRITRIKELFTARFGIELKEHELYGNLAPRLMKTMDEFLHKEISDLELIPLTDYLSTKLHGKSILTDKNDIKKDTPEQEFYDRVQESISKVKDNAASPSKIKCLEESQTKPFQHDQQWIEEDPKPQTKATVQEVLESFKQDQAKPSTIKKKRKE